MNSLLTTFAAATAVLIMAGGQSSAAPGPEKIPCNKNPTCGSDGQHRGAVRAPPASVNKAGADKRRFEQALAKANRLEAFRAAIRSGSTLKLRQILVKNGASADTKIAIAKHKYASPGGGSANRPVCQGGHWQQGYYSSNPTIWHPPVYIIDCFGRVMDDPVSPY